MLIAHLADIHLGKQQYRLEYREIDVYDLFREAMDYCIREHVRIIFISGDLFDEPRPRINALKTVLDEFRRALSHDIKVVVIPGDHDVPKRRDRLIIDILPDIINGVYPLGYIAGNNPIVKKVFEEYKIAVYALPFIPHRSIAKNVINKFLGEARIFFKEHQDYKTVLLAHYSLREFLPYDALLSITQLPKVDYAALGHIHDRIRQYIPEGGILSYPGSIDIFSVSEALSWREKGKGFNIVDLSRKEPSIDSIHWINLDVRPQYIIELSSIEEDRLDKEITDFINTSSKKPIIIHIKARIHEELVDKLRAITNKITMKHNKNAYIRLYIESIEESLENTAKKLDHENVFDEVSIIASILKIKEEVARNIVSLAEKLSSGEYSMDYVVDVLKSLYNTWYKSLETKRTTQRLYQEKITPDNKQKTVSKKRSLLDYIN